MTEERVKEIIDLLSQIEEDSSVPKNIRTKIKKAMTALEESDKKIEVRVNKSLQELDSLDEETNIPQFTRAQIWHVVSSLESI